VITATQYNLTDRLMDFIDALRVAGVAADLGRVEMFFESLGAAPILNLHWLYLCGRPTLCVNLDEVRKFDACFNSFFLDRNIPQQEILEQETLIQARSSSAEQRHEGRGQNSERELELGAASEIEVLRNRKFSKLTEAERQQVFTLIAALSGQVATRRSRRFRPFSHRHLDLRRTVRAALAHAGEPDRLYMRKHRRRPRPRILLVDVSGSMLPYAEALLRFAYAAWRCAPRATEVFTMGTRLTRLTPHLRNGDPDSALRASAKAIPDWAGGTRLGDQMKAFLDFWGQRGMARGAIVVIASDGWERGGAEQLRFQMQRMRRLAYRVIWTNPHKSSRAFEPLTAGMRAALPFLHEFVAGSTAGELAVLMKCMGDAK
jgi:uncharacterized protein with von Willebrand factor type A (vWA) domain